MPRALSEEQVLRIYRDTIDTLYGYVSRRCGGDRDMAEDVTQETWLRAVRDWREKGVPQKPIAWLTVVARNLVLNSLRRRQPVSLESVSHEQMIRVLDTEESGDGEEVVSLVNYALRKLPEAQSRLIEAFHFERQSVALIASETGATERAVEGRLRRARQQLRRELEVALNGGGGDK